MYMYMCVCLYMYTSESLTVVRKREKMGSACVLCVCMWEQSHRQRMIFYGRDLDFVFFTHFADGTTGGFGP